MKTLSVIIPIYNDEISILPFYERAKPVLESLAGVSWELVFINDGSRDGSLQTILGLRQRDPRVKVVSLSRNFGYHPVIIAGLSSRQSDLYGIIHVDCEDPPELLARFYEEIQRGAQTVYGDRSNRDEAAWLVFFRWLFYWINRQIADAPVRLWMAEFVMFTKVVRDAVLVNKSTFPFLRAELGYVGYRTVALPYLREKRTLGVSHFNFYTLTKFAVGGFLSSSTFPLRAVLYLSALGAVAYLAIVALFGLDFSQAAQLASIASWFFLLLTTPMLALYLARTYKDVSARPLFCVDPEGTSLD